MLPHACLRVRARGGLLRRVLALQLRRVLAGLRVLLRDLLVVLALLLGHLAHALSDRCLDLAALLLLGDDRRSLVAGGLADRGAGRGPRGLGAAALGPAAALALAAPGGNVGGQRLLRDVRVDLALAHRLPGLRLAVACALSVASSTCACCCSTCASPAAASREMSGGVPAVTLRPGAVAGSCEIAPCIACVSASLRLPWASPATWGMGRWSTGERGAAGSGFGAGVGRSCGSRVRLTWCLLWSTGGGSDADAGVLRVAGAPLGLGIDGGLCWSLRRASPTVFPIACATPPSVESSFDGGRAPAAASAFSGSAPATFGVGGSGLSSIGVPPPPPPPDGSGSGAGCARSAPSAWASCATSAGTAERRLLTAARGCLLRLVVELPELLVGEPRRRSPTALAAAVARPAGELGHRRRPHRQPRAPARPAPPSVRARPRWSRLPEDEQAIRPRPPGRVGARPDLRPPRGPGAFRAAAVRAPTSAVPRAAVTPGLTTFHP